MQGASDTETQNGALGLCPSMRPCPLRRPTSGGEGRGSDGAWNQETDSVPRWKNSPGLLGVTAEEEVVLAAQPLPW